MSKRSVFGKTMVTVLAASTLFAGSVFAGAAEEPAQAPEEETTAAAAAQEEVRVLGTESADAQAIELTNKTGKVITFLDIYEYEDVDYETMQIMEIQQALIDQKYLDDVADGNFGPKSQEALAKFCEDNKLEGKTEADEEVLAALFGEDYDGGNLLKDDETIKADETVKVFFAADSEDNTSSASGKLLIPEYHAAIQYEGDDAYYELNILPEGEAAVQLFDENGMLYITYTQEGSEEEISTYDAEKVIYDAANAVVVYEDYSDYNDYGDYGDYGDYDYSYVEPVYDAAPEPVYDAGDTFGADGCIEDGVFY